MKYIVDFKNNTNNIEIQEYLDNNKCTILKTFNNFDRSYLVSTKDQRPPLTEIIEYVVDDKDHNITLLGDIVISDTNYGRIDPKLPLIQISTSDKKDWWKNYVMGKPDFDNNELTISRRGSDAIVYIMDTGVQDSHPEFKNSNIDHLYSVSGDFNDNHGHGTAIASLICGETCGLTSTKIKNVKINEIGWKTRQSDILYALDMILSDFLKNPGQLGIVNCSWSIPKNEHIEQKINVLIDAGLYFVSAIGNEGKIDNATPSSMKDVLTIGSFDENLEPSSFSNYSDYLNGWAPGENIRVADINGDYKILFGTSLAAAIQTSVLVYNFSSKMSNGKLLPAFQKRNIEFICNYTLSRTNLLDLSNSKYSNLPNRVSTIHNVIDLTNMKQMPFSSAAIKVGDMYSTMAFNPQQTKSVEIVKPLPENFVLLENGILHGSPATIKGSHQIIESEIKITLQDNSIMNKVMTFGILGEDFNRDSIDSEDPILDITLAVADCPESILHNPPGGTCTDHCQANGWGDFCNIGTDKVGVFCVCQFS